MDQQDGDGVQRRIRALRLGEGPRVPVGALLRLVEGLAQVRLRGGREAGPAPLLRQGRLQVVDLLVGVDPRRRRRRRAEPREVLRAAEAQQRRAPERAPQRRAALARRAEPRHVEDDGALLRRELQKRGARPVGPLDVEGPRPGAQRVDRGVEARRVVNKFRHRRQDLVPLHVLGPPRRRVQHRQVARVGEAQVHLDAVPRRPRVAQVPRERPLRRFREHLERDGADAPPRLHVFILPRGPVDARHDLFHELELLFFHDLADSVLAVAQARLDEAPRAAEVGELRRVRVGLAVQAALEAGVDERLRRRRGAGVAAVARRLDEALGRGPEPGLRGDGHERGRRARGVPGADLRGERQRAPDRVARRRRVCAQHLAPHGRRRPGGFHVAPRAPREAGDDLQVRLVRQQRVDDGPRAGERRVDAREQRRRRGPRGRGVAVRRRRVLPPVAPQRERGAQPAGRRR